MGLIKTQAITALDISSEAAQQLYDNSGGTAGLQVFVQGVLTGLTASTEYQLAVRLNDGTNDNDTQRMTLVTEAGQTRLLFSTGVLRLGDTGAPGLGHTLSLLLEGGPGDTSVNGTVEVVAREPELGVLSSVDGAVAPTTTVFSGQAADLSGTDDLYSSGGGMLVVFTSGALKGVPRPVTDYDGTTKAITVSPAFPAAPSDGDRFVLIGRA